MSGTCREGQGGEGVVGQGVAAGCEGERAVPRVGGDVWVPVLQRKGQVSENCKEGRDGVGFPSIAEKRTGW